MVSFEIFVKSMPPSLWELKVLPSFRFAFKIPDDVTVTNIELKWGGGKREKKLQIEKSQVLDDQNDEWI